MNPSPAIRKVLRRPIVGAFIVYGVGTWLGFATSAAPSALMPVAIAAACVAAWLLWLGSRAARRAGAGWLSASGAPVTVLLLSSLAALGWQRAATSPAVSLAAGWRGRLTENTRAVVRGVVADEPEREPGAGKGDVWHFTLRARCARFGDSEWVGTGAPLRVTWRGAPGGRPPPYGAYAEFAGRLRWPAGARLTSARMSLLTTEAATRSISRGHGSGVRAWCYAMRRDASRRLTAGIEDAADAVRVLNALLLGYRWQIDREVRDIFVRTGTLHIFAISGTHVAIAAGILVTVLRASRIARVWWAVPMAPLLILYTVATGAEASAVRACIMGVVFFAAPLLGRSGDTLSALAAAALLIVAWDPTDLINAGFVLSFSLVAGLVLLYPFVAAGMARAGRVLFSAWARMGHRGGAGAELAPWDVDPFAPPVHDERERFPKLAGRYVFTLVALSTAAWLVSTPLTAFYFERFVPVSLPGNLIVIPVTFLVLITGSVSLVAGWIAPWLGAVFNHANLALVRVLLGTTGAFADVPYGSVEMAAPPAWTVWAWFAVLGLVLYAWRARQGDAGQGRGVAAG